MAEGELAITPMSPNNITLLSEPPSLLASLIKLYHPVPANETDSQPWIPGLEAKKVIQDNSFLLQNNSFPGHWKTLGNKAAGTSQSFLNPGIGTMDASVGTFLGRTKYFFQVVLT